MNPRKLVLKAAVFLAAMTLFSSAANAEVVNTAEVSRSYYASHGDYKVPLQVDETYQIKIKNAKEDIKYISKVIYMSVTEISKKWTMPVRDWGLAYAQFMIYFEDRFAA